MLITYSRPVTKANTTSRYGAAPASSKILFSKKEKISGVFIPFRVQKRRVSTHISIQRKAYNSNYEAEDRDIGG